MVAGEHRVAVVRDLGGTEPEEPHQIGMGTEATVADADPELGAQACSHESVVDTFDTERCDGQRFGRERRPQKAHPFDPGDPFAQPLPDEPVVRGQVVPADTAEFVDRRV